MDQLTLNLFSDEEKENLNNLKNLADKKVLNDEDKKDLALLDKNPEVYLENKLDIYDSEPKPNPNVPFTDPDNWNFKAKDYLDAKVKQKKFQEVQKEIDDENNRLETKTFSTPFLDVPLSDAWKVKAAKNGKSPDYRWDKKKHQFVHRKTKLTTPTKEVIAAFNKTGPIKYSSNVNFNIGPIPTSSNLTSIILQNRKELAENEKYAAEMKKRYDKLISDYENSKPRGGLPSLKDLIEV